mgnify:CR=1 FL=1
MSYEDFVCVKREGERWGEYHPALLHPIYKAYFLTAIRDKYSINKHICIK